MELISQHTKKIMEECKVRARAAGLSFDNESLEYIVTNKDMLELSPKVMIPTLYDYWVNDVEVLKEYGKYKLSPHNPYETVINSRPAISFYNDNNPDWMNIMIFYHVLAHIDFFQNNILFENTWNDDFVGQALADKRLIANLRSEHGRWVDYIIEFSRNIDNLVGYFDGLARSTVPASMLASKMTDFYFDIFLQEIQRIPQHEYFKEVEHFNLLTTRDPAMGESLFFSEVKRKYPEFQAKFDKHVDKRSDKSLDLMEYIQNYSPMLRKEKNSWMKSVMSIVRNTSRYFQPQIRTKIINEGWASYWHDVLFRSDDRIRGHEIGYAKLNAGVTAINRVGLNPYAIGLRLIQHIEEMADKGKMTRNFQLLDNIEQRDGFDKKTGMGKEAIFNLRKNFSDFTLINTFTTQDFIDQFNLFVVGKRLDPDRGVYQYYIKSKKAADYKQMLIESLYHPPKVEVVADKTNDDNLYLSHRFEDKQLITDFIPDTLMGIEFLWGGQVQLETTEIINKSNNPADKPEYEYRRVLYTMKDKRVSKNDLSLQEYPQE